MSPDLRVDRVHRAVVGHVDAIGHVIASVDDGPVNVWRVARRRLSVDLVDPLRRPISAGTFRNPLRPEAGTRFRRSWCRPPSSGCLRCHRPRNRCCAGPSLRRPRRRPCRAGLHPAVCVEGPAEAGGTKQVGLRGEPVGRCRPCWRAAPRCCWKNIGRAGRDVIADEHVAGRQVVRERHGQAPADGVTRAGDRGDAARVVVQAAAVSVDGRAYLLVDAGPDPTWVASESSSRTVPSVKSVSILSGLRFGQGEGHRGHR